MKGTLRASVGIAMFLLSIIIAPAQAGPHRQVVDETQALTAAEAALRENGRRQGRALGIYLTRTPSAELTEALRAIDALLTGPLQAALTTHRGANSGAARTDAATLLEAYDQRTALDILALARKLEFDRVISQLESPAAFNRAATKDEYQFLLSTEEDAYVQGLRDYDIAVDHPNALDTRLVDRYAVAPLAQALAQTEADLRDHNPHLQFQTGTDNLTYLVLLDSHQLFVFPHGAQIPVSQLLLWWLLDLPLIDAGRGGPPIQLAPGTVVQIASLEPDFPLRSAPSMQADSSTRIARSTRAVILSDPQPVFEMSAGGVPQDFIWWRIRTENQDEGWIQEHFYTEPILVPFVPANALPPVTCILSTFGDVNIRSGPGTTYEIVASRAGAGQTLAANGQSGSRTDPNNHWWQLLDGFWLRNDQVSEAGDCANLPLVATPLATG